MLKRVEIGQVDVDAGICWVGDPCYILAMPHSEELPEPHPLPKEFGTYWIDFCDTLHDKEEKGNNQTAQFNHDLGHPGLGVCVQTGYGDGSYPVYATFNKEGRVASVTVEFIELDENGDEKEYEEDDLLGQEDERYG